LPSRPNNKPGARHNGTFKPTKTITRSEVAEVHDVSELLRDRLVAIRED
jgi:hypothetical protein